MYMYVQRPGCKKENTTTYIHTAPAKNIRIYGQGLECLLAHTYGQGSCTWLWLGRNGETASSSCSWGANRPGRNRMCRRVHREPTGLDGTVDGNEAWHTAKWRKLPCVRPATVETGSCSSGGVWGTAKWRTRTSYDRSRVLLIGRGVPYRKTEETDLCWSATVETGVLFIGKGVAYRKTGLHGILFISTVDLLQPPRLLFIHRRPPPASTCDCSSTASPLLPPPATVHPRAHVHPASAAPPPATVQPALSTGSCSTTPPRATVHLALHRLLFNQPSTGVMFIQPSMGSCSSNPNWLDWGHVHPAAMASTTTRSYSSNPPPGTVHPTPSPTTLIVDQGKEAAGSIGFS